MRHGKHTFKIGRTSAHRRCMIANMLKSLIKHGRITTTLTKAKELKRHADRMITLGKKGTISDRRLAIAKMMIRNKKRPSKKEGDIKKGKSVVDKSDRPVIGKLFGELSQRLSARPGGYTRIIPLGTRIGDNASMCIIEYLTQS